MQGLDAERQPYDTEGPPVPLHLRTVKLSTVIHRLVEKTFHELTALTERYCSLLLHLNGTNQKYIN